MKVKFYGTDTTLKDRHSYNGHTSFENKSFHEHLVASQCFLISPIRIPESSCYSGHKFWLFQVTLNEDCGISNCYKTTD